MRVTNPNRAVAAVLAAIAGTGALAGFAISATTTSVNAGAGAGVVAAPAPPSTTTLRPGTDPATGPGGGLQPVKAVALAPTAAARHAAIRTSTAAPGGAGGGSASTSPRGAPQASPSSGTPAGGPSGSSDSGTGKPAATAAACSSGDVSLVTATDASGYAPGAPVRITTTVRDLVACLFEPAAASSGDGAGAGSSCATTVAVTDAAGDRVWPVPGQVEQCAPVAATALVPGQTLDVAVVWTGVADVPGSPLDLPAPPGRYQAVGTWSWSGPGEPASSGAAPVSASAVSAPFTVG